MARAAKHDVDVSKLEVEHLMLQFPRHAGRGS